jgi:hypothetical protein
LSWLLSSVPLLFGTGQPDQSMPDVAPSPSWGQQLSVSAAARQGIVLAGGRRPGEYRRRSRKKLLHCNEAPRRSPVSELSRLAHKSAEIEWSGIVPNEFPGLGNLFPAPGRNARRAPIKNEEQGAAVHWAAMPVLTESPPGTVQLKGAASLIPLTEHPRLGFKFSLDYFSWQPR